MAYTNGQTTVENTSKKISKNVNSMKDQSADMITEVRERGENFASDVSAYVQSEGAAIYENLQERISQMGADLADLRNKAEKTFRQHPYYTILGATAVGVLAGLILRGRGRK